MRPWLAAKSQYARFRKCAAWVSRKTNCAPSWCRQVWTLFCWATPAILPLSNSQTVADGLNAKINGLIETQRALQGQKAGFTESELATQARHNLSTNITVAVFFGVSLLVSIAAFIFTVTH